MKRLFLTLVTFLLAAMTAVGLSACGGNSETVNGTYYLFENGTLDKTQFVTLDGKKWTDDENATGELEISGDNITLYVELFGEKEEFASGTVKNGVLTLNIMGAEIVYCKEGKTPSGGDTNNPSTQYTVTYNANGGTFADNSSTLTQNENKNSLLTAPTSPIKTGATFSGWATSANGSTLWKFASDTVTKNMTLYAVWNEEAAALISVDGASITDRSVFMLADKNTEYVSLAQMVVCSSGSTWRLYYDRLGLTEIATKIAAQTSGSLYNGDNAFYIVVTSSDGTQVNTYELTIHRSYAVSVNYYDNKNNPLDSKTVYTGNEFTANYIPNIDGYTFNGWKDDKGITFTSDTLWKSLSLYADCKANTYIATLDVNGGDSLTTTSKTVTYDESYRFSVPSRTGYTFLGWYVGTTQLTDEKGSSLAVWTYTSDKTITAKWQANDYAVTLKTNDSNAGTVTGNGNHKYDSSVTITAKTNTGYTWLGWYDKNGELVTDSLSYEFTMGFDVTYTAKWTYYTVTTTKNNTSAGTATSYDNKKITVGNKITLIATTYLGYDWLGWYNGETLLTQELSYTFVMPTENVTYTAKWEVKSELSNFNFTSKATTLTINGVKNKSVTEITVPDYATSISQGAFSGCSSLESITLPFVGETVKTALQTYQYPLGYIFGTNSYQGGTSTTQHYYSDDKTNPTFKTYYIPTTLRSVTVTGGNILYGAFYYCSSLTSITIPDSVTSIGERAFYYCSSLTSITIPDSVTSIGQYAFSGCRGLASITIPDGLTICGYNAFSGCQIETATMPAFVINFIPQENLKTVVITSGARIRQSAFKGCSGLTSATIGNSVTSIGASAFEGCSGLTNITIPDSVTSIGDSAFKGCSGLTSATIGNGVTSIGASAFSGCDKLIQKENGISYVDKWVIDCDTSVTSVILRNDTVGIEERAFQNYHNLTSIKIPDGVKSIGDYAFYGCSGLTSITIGNSVTSIGERAFEGCSSLTSITIPDSVTSIGGLAFMGCSSLTSVTIGNGVTSLEASVFYECTSLKYNEYDNAYYLGNINNPYLVLVKAKDRSITSCKIHDNTKFIYSNAFYYCSSLTSITIPDSVTSIGGSAFSGCSGLTSITIPDGVKRIERETFRNCYKLTSITIPDSVTSIGDFAFSECSGLTSVTIGNGVTSIGQSAFYNCSGLTSVTIGNSVTSIEYQAFYNCYKLTSIRIPDGVTSIGDYAFYGCYKLTSIRIPGGVTRIGQYVFSGCSSLTSITIPDSVTSIGQYAFYECTSLGNITFQGTKKQWNAIEKGMRWNGGTYYYTIYCTDGDITKS